MSDDGDDNVKASLYYDDKILWEIDEDCSHYNNENCEMLIRVAQLNEIDKREFEFIIK